MSRIQPVTSPTDTATSELFRAVKEQMGVVPNIIATMANSTAVAKAYLGFSQELSTGTLSPRLREQIALVVGEENNCDYCVAAHTVLGKGAGLTEHETLNARQSKSSDAKEEAALKFAREIVQTRGNVSEIDVKNVRLAGYSDGEVGEIVANVALNIFTNYFNHVASTEIDFPLAAKLRAA